MSINQIRLAAKLMGSRGGLKGGKARWANKSDAERAAHGRMMAEAKKAKRLVQSNQ